MEEIQKLKDRIEIARDEMHLFAARYGMSDSRTVGQSQYLDHIMNEFYRLNSEKKPIA